MQSSSHRIALAATGVSLSVVALASAADATPLSSLAPGSSYRLLFTTRGTVSATSTDISVYNTFVTNQAALNSALPVTSWKDIGSTTAVNATINVSCGSSCDASVPIFTLDGTQIASSTNSFFSGSILSRLDVDQFGARSYEYVWTGSTSAGVASTSALGQANVTLGDAISPSFALNSQFTGAGNQPNPLYGISGALTVPTPVSVPEPASLLLLGLGGMAAGLARRRSV